MLLSSSGFFFELGLFCYDEDICRKMFVIVDVQYKIYENYMNIGLIIEVRENGVRVEFIDYVDKDQCWIYVELFVIVRVRRCVVRRIMG